MTTFKMMKTMKSPSEDLSMTNRVFLSPGDWNEKIDKYISIECSSKKHVFRSGTDTRIPPGCVSLGALQRKWMYVGVSESVRCAPYAMNDSGKFVLTELVLELDLFKKNSSLKDPVDSDKLAMRYQELFDETPVTRGQMILLAMDGVNFELSVLELRGYDARTADTGGAGGAGGAGGDICQVEIGIVHPNVVIKFNKNPEAKFVLTGRSRGDTTSGMVNILNPNWDFNSIGVGGLDEEFSHIFRRAFLSRLLPPDYTAELGLKHVRGILLYGPPGTGKTLTARQIGKMLNAREPKIVNGPSILDKYVGESEANIRKLFADAEEEFKRVGERSALHIIIFDEIDAICKARGSLSSSSAVHDTVVNQLLSKMDGVEQLNNILVIGMTNRRDMIDEALLRPGRMGVQIEVPLPSETGRLQIFTIHTRKLKEKGVIGEDVSLDELAKLTKNFSGAEIEGLVMAAFSNAQNETFDPKKGMAIRPEDLDSFRIMRKHFLHSLEHDVKPFFGRDEGDLQQLLKQPVMLWGPHMTEALEKAAVVIKGLREGQSTSKAAILLHGSSLTGKTTLAAHLAQLTEFTFVRICSIRKMIGFTESGRCLAIKKVFDDALKAPSSVVILDDLEHLIDYSSIGPRFSIYLLKNLIGMIDCVVPEGKKMLIIGTTKHLAAMRELELYEAFGKNAIKVPMITQVSEVMAVLSEQQDLFDEAELDRIKKHLRNDPSTNISIGVKEVVNECGILRSVDKDMRVDLLLLKLKASGDEIDY